MNKEIKPCPFCGGVGHIGEVRNTRNGERYKVVKCGLCGASGKRVSIAANETFEDKENYIDYVIELEKEATEVAIEAWNTRSSKALEKCEEEK